MRFYNHEFSVSRRVALLYWVWEYGLHRANTMARERKGTSIVLTFTSRRRGKTERERIASRVDVAAAFMAGRAGYPLPASIHH